MVYSYVTESGSVGGVLLHSHALSVTEDPAGVYSAIIHGEVFDTFSFRLCLHPLQQVFKQSSNNLNSCPVLVHHNRALNPI